MSKKDQIRPGPQGIAIRRRGEHLGAGILKKMEDGKPLPEGAELIYVGAADDDGWHDVTSLYKQGELAAGTPTQVASPQYREGHDRIFGKKQKVGLA